MTQPVLEQKRGLSTRKFTLLPDRILVESKNVRTVDRYEVKLELLGNEKHYQADSTMVGKIVIAVFLLMPALLAIGYFNNPTPKSKRELIAAALLSGLVALIGFLKQHKDDIFLVGGQKNLVFFRAVPDEASVLRFIDQVIAASRAYMHAKYTVIDINLPEEVFAGRLTWLKEQDIIDDIEVEELLASYTARKLYS
jgi:hypothetical protein